MKVAIDGVFIDPIVANESNAKIAQQLIIETRCGIRHVVSWSSPFTLTGDINFDTMTTAEPIKDWVRKYWDGMIHSYYLEAEVVGKRKFKYGEVILYRRTDETIPKLRTLIKGYLVFDVAGSKAVLVDEEPEKMLLIVIHKVYSKTKSAKIVANFPFVFKDVTSCARQSNALAVALIDPKPAKKNIYCLNDPPFRYEREERYPCYAVDINKEEYIGTFTDPKLAFEL
jgi:hypothetical protein